MKIIDAHMHYYRRAEFTKVAQRAGHENTAECWANICKDNNIVFSVAMGNTHYIKSKLGGSSPRLIDLSGEFLGEEYNQPKNMGYCLGVKSEEITLDIAEKTAQEFEHYLQKKECLGIKLYPGYNPVYVDDKRHWPLFELAQAYDVPVAIHTGDTAATAPHARLKYAHPLTVDDVASQFPKVKFVICHCGNPWILDATEVAAKNDNVFIDLSGLLEGRPNEDFYKRNEGYFSYLRTWLTYLNRWQKIMYGSDWPLVNIPQYIAIMKKVVPVEHHEDFFYNNATRIYNKIPKLLEK